VTKAITMELIIFSTRFNNVKPGAPFFWGNSKKNAGLWFKAKTNTSAFCIETGEIKYVKPYTRVEEIVGGI
jgi:hypothetical protein